ncbi:hypothetical protein AgCh_004363 [Apium graveolens]
MDYSGSEGDEEELVQMKWSIFNECAEALQLVLAACKPKAKIVDICEKGDAFIKEHTGNKYKNVKKKIEKGIAFPTCLSVNNTVCHFSPLASDEAVLEEGDVLKIDMGCHVDGFIAVVAHTHVLQDGKMTGKAADVIAAANTAAEVALRLVRHGKKPYPVLHENPGDYVAHIKFTVLLMPNGSDRITSHPLQELEPTKAIDDPEIKAWLALGIKTKKRGGGKKKKAQKNEKGEDSAEPGPADAPTDSSALQE